ncbi:hypothetical protein BX070DRAFT_231438 [Coemansia spiralis]|nr:hypothetical protein BX070DRAFT_231438 [Coemansia spiralis]
MASSTPSGVITTASSSNQNKQTPKDSADNSQHTFGGKPQRGSRRHQAHIPTVVPPLILARASSAWPAERVTKPAPVPASIPPEDTRTADLSKDEKLASSDDMVKPVCGRKQNTGSAIAAAEEHSIQPTSSQSVDISPAVAADDKAVDRVETTVPKTESLSSTFLRQVNSPANATVDVAENTTVASSVKRPAEQSFKKRANASEPKLSDNWRSSPSSRIPPFIPEQSQQQKSRKSLAHNVPPSDMALDSKSGTRRRSSAAAKSMVAPRSLQQDKPERSSNRAPAMSSVISTISWRADPSRTRRSLSVAASMTNVAAGVVSTSKSKCHSTSTSTTKQSDLVDDKDVSGDTIGLNKADSVVGSVNSAPGPCNSSSSVDTNSHRDRFASLLQNIPANTSSTLPSLSVSGQLQKPLHILPASSSGSHLPSTLLPSTVATTTPATTTNKRHPQSQSRYRGIHAALAVSSSASSSSSSSQVHGTTSTMPSGRAASQMVSPPPLLPQTMLADILGESSISSHARNVSKRAEAVSSIGNAALAAPVSGAAGLSTVIANKESRGSSLLNTGLGEPKQDKLGYLSHVPSSTSLFNSSTDLLLSPPITTSNQPRGYSINELGMAQQWEYQHAFSTQAAIHPLYSDNMGSGLSSSSQLGPTFSTLSSGASMLWADPNSTNINEQHIPQNLQHHKEARTPSHGDSSSSGQYGGYKVRGQAPRPIGTRNASGGTSTRNVYAQQSNNPQAQQHQQQPNIEYLHTQQQWTPYYSSLYQPLEDHQQQPQQQNQPGYGPPLDFDDRYDAALPHSNMQMMSQAHIPGASQVPQYMAPLAHHQMDPNSGIYPPPPPGMMMVPAMHVPHGMPPSGASTSAVPATHGISVSDGYSEMESGSAVPFVGMVPVRHLMGSMHHSSPVMYPAYGYPSMPVAGQQPYIDKQQPHYISYPPLPHANTTHMQFMPMHISPPPGDNYNAGYGVGYGASISAPYYSDCVDASSAQQPHNSNIVPSAVAEVSSADSELAKRTNDSLSISQKTPVRADEAADGRANTCNDDATDDDASKAQVARSASSIAKNAQKLTGTTDSKHRASSKQHANTDRRRPKSSGHGESKEALQNAAKQAEQQHPRRGRGSTNSSHRAAGKGQKKTANTPDKAN